MTPPNALVMSLLLEALLLEVCRVMIFCSFEDRHFLFIKTLLFCSISCKKAVKATWAAKIEQLSCFYASAVRAKGAFIHILFV